MAAEPRLPRPLILILVLFAGLALAYNFADPIFEPPDEVLHYDFVRYLQSERQLPVVRLTDPPSELHQPPLYYVVAAALTAWIPRGDYVENTLRNPFWAYAVGSVGRDNKNQFLHGPSQRFPYQGTALAVHLIRLLSTLAGGVAVYFTYRLTLALLPAENALALAAAALVAFTPNFLLTSAAVSNDALISMAPAGLMLLIFHLLDQPGAPRPRQWGSLSLLLSLSLLVKVSAYPLALVAAALAAILAYRQSSRRAFVVAGFFLAGGALLLTGWWFARNLALYSDLTGLGQMWKVWGTRPPLTLSQVRVEAWNILTTYWANLGYGNVPLPNGFYLLILGMVMLSVMGLLWRAADRLRRPPPTLANDKLALMAVWMVTTFIALGWYLQRTVQVTGRQLYAIIPAIAFCLIWGWARLVPQHWRPALAIATAASMFALSLYTLLAILGPAYAPNPRLSSDEAARVIQHRLDWQLEDEAVLLGYEISPQSIEPGQTALVTLYWESLKPNNHNDTVFVHLFGAEGVQVGARDTYPGLGNDPTRYWQPGQIIVDTIPVQLDQSATGPILLDVEAGLYDLDTGVRLSIRDAGGGLITQPIIGHLKLAATTRSSTVTARAPLAIFEGGAVLESFALNIAEPSAGQMFTVTLRWSAAGPLNADYTVFVQLVDAAGQIV
ncbi:MAG: glycosyltransferase family 39 protein, partial [Anaerolineales bacterium]